MLQAPNASLYQQDMSEQSTEETLKKHSLFADSLSHSTVHKAEKCLGQNIHDFLQRTLVEVDADLYHCFAYWQCQRRLFI